MQTRLALDNHGECTSTKEPRLALAILVKLQMALGAAVSVKPNPGELPGTS